MANIVADIALQIISICATVFIFEGVVAATVILLDHVRTYLTKWGKKNECRY